MKIIDGMTIYKDVELKAELEQAGFCDVQIHKNKWGWAVRFKARKMREQSTEFCIRRNDYGTKRSYSRCVSADGGKTLYDGMITCSTLSGKAVCRLVWAMNKAENDAYLKGTRPASQHISPAGC